MPTTNAPIKTALCSFGMSGWVFHAPFIHNHPGFELYAVWERSKDLAAAKYPGIKTYRTLESMLADAEVELVVVNTPNYTHYEYTKKALQAGKHVVVEKPFTITVAEGEELIALSKKIDRQIAVYQNRRFDSDFRTVKKVVDEKKLGEVVEAEIHYDRYKEEPGPKLHKETPGPGTGLVFDLGSHLIDQALQLFGMPKAVFADVTIMRALSKVDDYMEILLYYPLLRVRLKSTYLAKEPTSSFIFHGTKGSFIKARTDVQEIMLQAGEDPSRADWGIEPDREKGLLHTEINGKEFREHIPSARGNYGDFYAMLYSALRENGPLPATAEQGLDVIRVIEAAYRSNREKRVIEF